MTVLRKPLVDAPTASERVNQLLKEINRLVDDINIAFEQIDKEIREVRGNIDGNSERNS